MRRHGRRPQLDFGVGAEGEILAEVTLVFVPLGALQWPMNVLFLIGGVSPRGPHRDKH